MCSRAVALSENKKKPSLQEPHSTYKQGSVLTLAQRGEDVHAVRLLL
jgi:hypothetical protein